VKSRRKGEEGKRKQRDTKARYCENGEERIAPMLSIPYFYERENRFPRTLEKYFNTCCDSPSPNNPFSNPKKWPLCAIEKGG